MPPSDPVSALSRRISQPVLPKFLTHKTTSYKKMVVLCRQIFQVVCYSAIGKQDKYDPHFTDEETGAQRG